MFKSTFPHRYSHESVLSSALRTIVSTALIFGCAPAAAQVGTAFTYQGVLKNSNAPFSGNADFIFSLFDDSGGDLQIGFDIAVNAVSVVDGVFTASIDFGAIPEAFDGGERWLEIEVRTPAGSANPFVMLSPRQRINATPYAQHADTVGTVGSAALSGTYGNALALTNASNLFTGAFAGSGSGLTALNASAISSGTLASARLSGTYGNSLTLSNALNAFTGTFTGTHSGSGASLTSLNASNIASGALNAARLPTGGNWSLSSALNVDAGTLVIDSANNRVGIGTASPLETLHVAGQLHIDSPLYEITWPEGNVFQMGEINTGTLAVNERMRILSNGNVGIGTGNVQADLHVARNGVNVDLLLKRIDATHGINFGVSNTPKLFISRYDGATYDDYFTLDGSTGSVGIGTTNPTSTLHVVGDAVFSGGLKPGSTAQTMTIGASSITAPSSLDIASASNMDIDSSASLNLDATTNLSLAGATVNIDSAGTMTLDTASHLSLIGTPITISGLSTLGINGGSGGFNLGVNGSAAKVGGGVWSSLSDARLKKNIQPLNDSLERVLALRGVTFEYRDPSMPLCDDRMHTGFIAQEVQQIFPQWVDDNADGYKTLSISGFEALTVEALRELRAEKDREIARLQDENDALRLRLEAIERAVQELAKRR